MNIAACVTLQNTCEKLIKYAFSLKNDSDSLFVLHVAKNKDTIMGQSDNAAALEYLYSVSTKYGADMTVLHRDDIVSSIAEFVKENNIEKIVLGVPEKPLESAIIRQLYETLKDCEIIPVDKKEI